MSDRPPIRRPPNTNPYHGLRAHELQSACRQRARFLVDRNSPRTTQQRADIAQDTSQLLLATASALGPHDPVSDTATLAVAQRPQDFIVEFLADHERNAQLSRYRTLVAASDLVYGSRAGAWLRDATIEGRRVDEYVMLSEQGLEHILAMLSKEYILAQSRRPTDAPEH